MPTLREYFQTESSEYIGRLDAAVASDTPGGDELLRVARALRGAAQMGREDRVRRVASALEVAAREIGRGARPWDDDTRRRIRETVVDLRTLAERGEGDAGVSAVAEQALARWREVGVSPEEGVAAAAGPAAVAGSSDAELRRYVASEARGVIAELEHSIPALTRSPMGRDPLKSILRRQRALLGSAGLERYPAISGTLQTIEDATRVVARQNLAVEGDWLAIYRQAHTVLNEAVARIEAGGSDDPSTLTYAELRGLRDRMIGTKAEAAPFQPPAAPGGNDAAELVGFFRTEATKLLDRVERMSGAFAAATEDRRMQLRQDLSDALNALRDTSRTFGFEEPARAAEEALSRLAEAASTTLLGTVERLRDIISSATDEAAGTGSAPHAAPTAHAAATPGAPVAPAAAAIIPIDELLYRGPSALRRIIELQPEIEKAVPREERAARESLDELFDLVRLAMS